MDVNSRENMAKSFAIAETTTEKCWDMWLVSLGSLSWTQEQFETMARKYLDQRKTAREETNKLVEELSSQAKKNQQQMQKMIEEAVTAAFENLEVPTFSYIDELSKKVEELSRKVDNL